MARLGRAGISRSGVGGTDRERGEEVLGAAHGRTLAAASGRRGMTHHTPTCHRGRVHRSARALVLVEGASDRRRPAGTGRASGSDLEDEQVEVVNLGGATNIGRFLEDLVTEGRRPRLAGMYDAPEERYFRRGLERAGLAPVPDRARLGGAGLLRVRARPRGSADPRARRPPLVEAVIEEQGELTSWRILQRQAGPADPLGRGPAAPLPRDPVGPQGDLRAGARRGRSTSIASPHPLSRCCARCEPQGSRRRSRHVRRRPQVAQRMRALEDEVRVVLPRDGDAAVQLDGLRRDLVEGVGAVGPRHCGSRARTSARAPSAPGRTPPRQPRSLPTTQSGTPRRARACRPSGA